MKEQGKEGEKGQRTKGRERKREEEKE